MTRLIGDTFRHGTQGFGQHGGVCIHHNAVVPVFLQCLEMDAGNDFRVDPVVFQADTRFARGHQEVGQGDGHTIWDSATQNRSYPLKRVHIVASEK